MSYNYQNIIESKDGKAIKFYLKDALDNIRARKFIIRESKLEIKKRQKTIIDFKKEIEKSLIGVKKLQNALKQIKNENKEDSK